MITMILIIVVAVIMMIIVIMIMIALLAKMGLSLNAAARHTCDTPPGCGCRWALRGGVPPPPTTDQKLSATA